MGKYHQSGPVYQHIVVAERALGRKLPAGAVVHHVDNNGRNNAPRNLVICQNQAYHRLLHARQRVQDAGGHPDVHKICKHCKQLLRREAFSFEDSHDGLSGGCRACTNARRRGKGYGVFTWRERMHQQVRRAVRSGRASCVAA